MIIAELQSAVQSQVPQLTWTTLVAIYGPMGAMLWWFATRAERIGKDAITELHVLGHRIKGMTLAMWADNISRTTDENMRAIYTREMGRADDEPEVQEIRSRSSRITVSQRAP